MNPFTFEMRRKHLKNCCGSLLKAREKFLRKFGFCPISELDRAYHEGRVDGQEEVMEMCRDRVEAVRLQYSGIERHRDALIKLIADGRALQPPAPIIIERGRLTY